jgi:hypothetical protein
VQEQIKDIIIIICAPTLSSFVTKLSFLTNSVSFALPLDEFAWAGEGGTERATLRSLAVGDGV